jgi:hypothetical protein
MVTGREGFAGEQKAKSNLETRSALLTDSCNISCKSLHSGSNLRDRGCSVEGMDREISL